MAIYTHTPSGGATVGCCCVTVTYYEYYVLPFGPGDQLFVKEQAQRGILEKVVIKTYTLQQSAATFGLRQVLYKDTFNRLWFEYELVSSANAIQYAKDYYNRLADQAARQPCDN